MASCPLKCAVEMLVKNFEKYAGGGGCCCRKQPRRISKKDFRKMLTRELNHMLTDTGNKRAADKLICDLDENKDGRISFEEYWTLIGGIASPIASLIRQQEQTWCQKEQPQDWAGGGFSGSWAVCMGVV
uniref:Protein S100 n=1 Tax=Crocodylus porosus TaxID=8502 RepID=A0A7M4F4S0_CROPO